jgi:hypothetical protein
MVTFLLHRLRLLHFCAAAIGLTARQHRDHRPGQENGRGESPVGCPGIHGELLKLGLDVAERSLLLTRALEARRLPAERREIIGVETAKRHYVQGAKVPRVQGVTTMPHRPANGSRATES